MERSLEITGDILERSELLNGTESVTLHGKSDDRRWELSGMLSWNLGLVDYAGEGDLTLVRDDGAELYGTVLTARARQHEGDWQFEAEYEIDGGAGPFSAASGRASAIGELAGDTFHGRWALDLGAGAT